MKKDEPQERTPVAGMTQEMSKAEILAYLEKMKKEESPEAESRLSRKPPKRRG